MTFLMQTGLARRQHFRSSKYPGSCSLFSGANMTKRYYCFAEGLLVAWYLFLMLGVGQLLCWKYQCGCSSHTMGRENFLEQCELGQKLLTAEADSAYFQACPNSENDLEPQSLCRGKYVFHRRTVAFFKR